MTRKHLLDMQLTEKCAVFGIFGPEHKKQTGLEAARLTFYGLWSLQHRGQESSGIASTDGKSIFRHAASGLVSTVYREEDIEQLPGHIAIGHNRYSTSGGADERHNQPFVDQKRKFGFAHNGNLPDTTVLEEFLSDNNIDTEGMNDSAMMSVAMGVYLDKGQTLTEAIKSAWPLFTGVFSAVVIARDRLIAFRDECGVRPLSLAKLDDGYCISSETCAFDTIGAEFVRDIEPGEMIEITDSGIKSEQVVKPNPRLDIFEMVYFARPDSLLNGRRVGLIRQDFGVEMAKEFPIEADVIVPVPESGIPAAQGYSAKTGIPFEMALIKNRYIHRTFIRPTEALRERDLKMKLNPVTELLKGKRVVLVDDSIVRGTTMRHLVQMVFEAGAKEVHLIITCPPVKYPDFYGINTPRQNELMAAYMTVDEIRDHVGATSLHFLSFEGMVNATGLTADKLTTSCFNGDYPISIGKRAKEIKILKEGETLPKAGLHEVELANTPTR